MRELRSTSTRSRLLVYVLGGMLLSSAISSSCAPQKACTNDASCASGQICFSERCVKGCRKSEDCPTAQVCLDFKCTDKVCEGGRVRVCYAGPAGTNQVGECYPGKEYCSFAGQWDGCSGQLLPQNEVCDRADNDCNGLIDDGITCQCTPGRERKCFTGPQESRGVGECVVGTQTCLSDRRWGPCRDQRLPTAEICDKKDNDCDGDIDEGLRCTCSPGERRECYPGPPGSEGKGRCRKGTQRCGSDETWDLCQGAILPKSEECNGLDDDCDGKIDDLSGCDLPQEPTPREPPAQEPPSREPPSQEPPLREPPFREPPAFREGSREPTPREPQAEPPTLDKRGEPPSPEPVADGGPGEPTPDAGEPPPEPSREAPPEPKAEQPPEASCAAGQTRSCTSPAQGACRPGTQQCQAGVWSTCTPLLKPQTEVCDGIDNDCNGKTDDGISCRFCVPGKLAYQTLGHSGKIKAMAISKDRKWLATGGDDTTIKIWEVATGKLHQTLGLPWNTSNGSRVHGSLGHRATIVSLAFHPTAFRLVSASRDTSARLWDLKTGKTLRVFGTANALQLQDTFAAINSDGTRLALSASLEIAIYDLSTGALVRTLPAGLSKASTTACTSHSACTKAGAYCYQKTCRTTIHLQGHTAPITGLRFHPNQSALLASSSKDGTVRLWDASNGSQSQLFGPGRGNATSTTCNASHRCPTGACIDGKCFDDDPAKGHVEAVQTLRFSPGGALLASVGADRTVRLWDLQGKLLRTLGIGGEAIPQSTCTKASDCSAGTFCAGGTCRKYLLRLGFVPELRAVAFQPDGKRLAVGTDWGDIRIWDVATGIQTSSLARGANAGSKSCQFHSSCDAGEACLGDLHQASFSGVCSRQSYAKGHIAPVYGLAFSTNDALWSASGDRSLRSWSVAQKKLNSTHDGRFQLKQMVFSQDQKRLWAQGHQELLSFDVATGKLLTLQPLAATSRDIAFSPDRKTIALSPLAATATHVELYDISKSHPAFLKNLGRLQNTKSTLGPTLPVARLQFGTRGTLLYGAANDRTIRIWDIATGALSRTFGRGAKLKAGSSCQSDAQCDRLSSEFCLDGNCWKPEPTLGHTGFFGDLQISPNGRYLGAISTDPANLTQAHIWDLSNYQLRGRSWTQDQSAFIRFHPNASQLAIVNASGSFRTFPMSGAFTPSHHYSAQGKVQALRYGPTDLLIASVGPAIHFWDPSTKSQVRVVSAGVVGPVGKACTSTQQCDPSKAEICYQRRCRVSSLPLGHTDPIDALASSRDGKLLFSHSSIQHDLSLRLWKCAP